MNNQSICPHCETENKVTARSKEEIKALESRINALMQILPEEYHAGFITSIKKLNGYPSKQYLTKYYLEIQDDKICISK